VNLLIMDHFTEEYKKALGPKFPEISISTIKTTLDHEVPEKEEIRDLIENMDILLVTKISDELIKKASRLKWIQSRISGVDHILNLPSLKKEVLITSARGIHGPQMSEMAMLFMLALSRNFPQIIRNQEKRLWERWSPTLLYQKKVGILGVGACGKEIALKCKAFGMTVYGIARTKRKVDGVDYFFTSEELLQVIQEVDYFIIAAPSTPQTKKMIGAKAFSYMKPTAFLINIGRGDIIDEEALIDALKAEKIAGAALDAFCIEPLPKDHPLWSMKNVIITPHVGGFSDIYVEQVLSIFEENLRRFLRGERRNLINLIER
jgi:D-2-hydroxyacid dehydrogenase (NADP+)